MQAWDYVYTTTISPSCPPEGVPAVAVEYIFLYACFDPITADALPDGAVGV
jgi:hypothetical protein